MKALPQSLVNGILEATPWIKTDIETFLPVSLGRGIPHSALINHLGIQRARESYFGDTRQRGYPTITAPKARPDDPNAFRGLADYIEAVQGHLSTDYGVTVAPDDMITGSGGGFELVSLITDYYKGKSIGAVNPTYNRFIKRNLLLGRGVKDIVETSTGPDLDKAEDFFFRTMSGLLYIVLHNNPSGVHISHENLGQLCQAAKNWGGILLIDGAYLNLYFGEEGKLQLASIIHYIKDGTTILVGTHTKEGGTRGAAFALGFGRTKEECDFVANTRLSPIYDTQGIAARYINNIGAKEWLKNQIRPQLEKSFLAIKAVCKKAGVRLSNENVYGGYNVCVLMPLDAKLEQIQQFFEELNSLGVETNDLSSFYVNLYCYPRPSPGFRIPFGGFSVHENTAIALIIAEAHRRTFGG